MMGLTDILWLKISFKLSFKIFFFFRFIKLKRKRQQENEDNIGMLPFGQ
jgi:preprotein translocase subunit YajC